MTPKRRSTLALAAALAALGLLVVLVAVTATAQEPVPQSIAGDNEWTPLGGPMAPGGQVNALAVHPDNSGTLYASAAPMGPYYPLIFETGPSTIYKSEDGAASWTPLHESANQIFSLAAAGTKVYAGAFNQEGEGPGLLVSGDSGLSWTTVLTFPNRGAWVDLDVDPANPDRAIAGGWLSIGDRDMGLVVGTLDGGDTWDSLLNVVLPGENATVNAVLVHPITPTILLAAVRQGDNEDTVLYRSDDGGATWPDAFTIPGQQVMSLAAHRTDPHMLYAGTGNSAFTQGETNVHRSIDAGLTWTQVVTGAGGLVATDAGTVYAIGADTVFASASDGDPGTWSHRADLGGTISLDIDLGPAPTALYVGSSHKVQKSVDGGASWTDSFAGIETWRTPIHLELDPTDGSRLFAAAELAGAFRTVDGGASWTQVMLGYHVNGLGIDPTNPQVVYAGIWACATGSIWRSEDGGDTWSEAYTPPFFEWDPEEGCTGGAEGIYRFAVAPTNPDTVFAAGLANRGIGNPSYDVVLRSLDGGLSWTEVLTRPEGWKWELVVSPIDDHVVYATLNGCETTPCNGQMYRSTDRGDTWAPTLASTVTIASVAIDPFDPDVVYAADVWGWVHKSEDSGDAWSVIRNPDHEPSGWLVIADPNMPGHLYLGGGGYVGESPDGGLTWSDPDAPLNSSTPHMGLEALVVSHETPYQTLYAAFSGVWSHTRLAPTEGDRYVAKTGSDADNTCTDPDAPCLTVDYALGLANPGETIRVAEGTYVENLSIEEQITLQGGYSGPPAWDRDLDSETILQSGSPTVYGDWDGGQVDRPTVIHNGTEYEMWFVGWDIFGDSRIGHATGGVTSWTKSPENPLLESDSADVLLEDGQYRMWYTHPGESCIWTAWSDDGLIWTEDPEPALCPLFDDSWDRYWVGDPSVVEADGTYWMYYDGWNSWEPGIGCATSTDALNWTRCAENPVLVRGPDPWDADSIGNPEVVYDGTNFRMWYTGHAGDYRHSIGYATSPDGVTWSKHGGNPVLEPSPAGWDDWGVNDPAVWFDGTTYHLWYGSGSAIGYAESADGTAWTKHPEPVLETGWYGEWGQPVVEFGAGSDDALLDGFTVTGGEACWGAGIQVDSVAATIANCFVHNNTSPGYCRGGGIDVQQETGHATIVDSEVTGNEAKSGGGIRLSNSASATILRSAIHGNYARESGGGVDVVGSGTRLTMEDTAVSNNVAAIWGGGIGASTSAVVLRDVVVNGNQSVEGEGGGLFLVGGSTAVLTDVVVTENVAGTGPAGMNIIQGSQVTMAQVVVQGNTAPSAAGLRADASTVTGSQVSILENVATDEEEGGFRLSDGAAMTLTNALIAGNAGGAGHLSGGVQLHLSHATIADNWREDGTGGLQVEGDCSATLLNSILAFNNGPGLECDEGASCTVESSNLQYPWDGPGNISTNPRFVDRASGDYHLAAGSPCIDAADPAHAPDHDLDGDPRPYDGDDDLTALPDMGADEYTGPPAPIEYLTDFYVDHAAPPGGDGTPDRPYQTVNEAVGNAFSGDTVHIADGTYVENVQLELALTLLGGYSGLGDPFWIRDPGTYETVLDGSDNPHIPPDWDVSNINGPDLIWDEEAGEYKAYYAAEDTDGIIAIGMATSTDGQTWTKYAGNPVLMLWQIPWDESLVWSPTVLKRGPTDYRMWFGCSAGIGYATSEDGINWVVHPVPVLEGSSTGWDEVVFGPSVVYTDTQYLMAYSGNEDGGWTWQVGIATSPDGVTWARYEGNPVITLGEPGEWDQSKAGWADMVYADGAFHMMYTGHDDVTVQIGAATSGDGLTWTKYEGNPVLGPGDSGWENSGVLRPGLLWQETGWKMMYNAYGDLGGAISQATSDDGLVWVRDTERNPVLMGGSWGQEGAPTVHVVGAESAAFTDLTITGGYYWEGGGLKIESSNVTITGCSVEDNGAEDLGGGIHISEGASVLISDTRIISNVAGYGGGLGATDSSAVSMRNSTVSQNWANGPGGGLSVSVNTVLNAADCLIIHNTGAHGGGISMSRGAFARLERTDLLHNNGGTDGGGISLKYDSSLEYTDGLVQGNSAVYMGAGISGFDTVAVLERVTVSGNRLEFDGLWGDGAGLAFTDGAVASLTDVLIEGNASRSAGGLDVRGSAEVTLDGVEIRDNTAETTAALRLSEGARVSGDRLWLQDNVTLEDGVGGLEVVDSSALTLTNALIAGNAGGAGLVDQSSQLYLSHATVTTANQRGDGPGGLFVSDDSQATIYNSILYYNGGTDLDCAPGAVCTVAFSDLQSSWTGPGSDNISADPQFVDWPARDYHLAATSPAIDTADPAHAVDHDTDEESRPYDGDGSGSAEPDMGYDEYHGDPALHDVALVGALPGGDVQVGLPISVTADLYNGGDFEEDQVPVLCTIWQDGDLEVYAETAYSGPIAPVTYALVEFPDWTPSATGPYTLSCESQLPEDADPANDAFTRTGTVVPLGGEPDVWARDNEADTGDVPSESPFWVSPDIWVRNQPDGGLVHQNPVAFEDNTVYVRIRNRGTAPASGQVGVYWDRSRIGWPCYEGPPNVGVMPFTDLAPGEVRILPISWTPQEPGHHGLYIVIDAVDDPANWDARCSPHLPRWDNNVAWHNVIVFAHPPAGSPSNSADIGTAAAEETLVYLTNPYELPKTVDLTILRGTFPAEGTISLLLGQTLMDRWLAYGSQGSQGIEINTEAATVTVTGQISATLIGLPLGAGEERQITVYFDAGTEGVYEVQFEEEIDGGLVGGLTYRWIELDTVPPEVVGTWPPDGAVDVELSAPLVITFTEPIGPLSFHLTLDPDPGTAGWLATWGPDGTIVTVTHPALAPGQTYAVDVSAGDAFANPVAAYPWSFTTVGSRIYLPVIMRNY